MIDLALNEMGDLDISDIGDISLTDSIRQTVLIRLKWILGEWRLGPELGFPYFEEMLIKNPNLDLISQLIKEEILKVEDIQDAEITSITYDPRSRRFDVSFEYVVDEERYKEEVELNV